MTSPHPFLRSVLALLAGFSLIFAGFASAQDETAEKRSCAAIKKLSLRDCLHFALEHQPSVAAARASLAAAVDGLQALDSLHAPAALVSRDLPIRRQQACVGVSIAQAALQQAELETAYNVTRTYLTVLYAQDQLEVAGEVVKQLEFYHDIVEKALKSNGNGGRPPPRDWTDLKVYKIAVYLRLAENKRSEASQGIERALAALREAMGTCPDFPLALQNQHLFQPDALRLSKEELMCLALAHRAEVAQAVQAVELFTLEVDAQDKTCLGIKVPTFASGGDIHARQVPQGVSNNEYRPGALAPEMPVALIGSRCARMERAHDFSTRAVAVADKTRGLVVLEIEDLYHRWLEAAAKLKQSRQARDVGKQLAIETRGDFRGGQKESIENVLTNEVLASQAHSAYNEALLQYLLTLAGLARATGGSFCAGLVEQAEKATAPRDAGASEPSEPEEVRPVEPRGGELRGRWWSVVPARGPGQPRIQN